MLEINCAQSAEKSAIKWLAKFVQYKLNSLSNKFVSDPEKLLEINLKLEQSEDLEELGKLARKARTLGLIGINTYFNPLKKFCAAIPKLGLKSFKELNEAHAVQLLSAISANLSDASKKNYRVAVISFFKFITEFNSEDFTYKISLKSWAGVAGNKGIKLPEYMDEAQLKVFLDTLNSFEFKHNAARNRLVVKIILFSGMRVSEALYLRVRDFTLVDNIYQIRIHGKGNKYRVVMVNASSLQAELLEVCDGLTPTDYLFLNPRTNKVLTQAYVSRVIEQVLLKAGIRKEKNGAHMLRHSFATLLYQKQKDIILVQEALGHASLETSRIYTHFDSDRLKLAAQVASELAKS